MECFCCVGNDSEEINETYQSYKSHSSLAAEPTPPKSNERVVLVPYLGTSTNHGLYVIR